MGKRSGACSQVSCCSDEADGAAYLMEDTTVVRRDIPRVEEETLLHCRTGQTEQFSSLNFKHARLLKLLIGVETSTRAVRRSGSEGKATKSSSRRATAAAKTPAFLLSTGMVDIRPGTTIPWSLVQMSGLRAISATRQSALVIAALLAVLRTACRLPHRTGHSRASRRHRKSPSVDKFFSFSLLALAHRRRQPTTARWRRSRRRVCIAEHAN